jgi:hypothetical protein
VHLGDARSRSIRTSPKPAETLVYMLYEYRYDTALIDAFRDYALGSTALFHLLTPQAKAEATARRGASPVMGRHLATQGTRGGGNQSTSIAPYAMATSPHPTGCEILFEGEAPLLAE